MNGARDEWLKREDSERKTGEWRMPSKREMSREELLGAWLGEEREPSVLADLRPMKADMESLVGEALASVGQEDMLILTKLQDHWGEIVKAEIAKMSKPLSLFRGTLRVRVLNSSLLFVFERQLKGEILKKVAEASHGVVTKIVYM
ncbi:MAG: DUF721 domain-containing protein [Victivallales bacterium]|nr:DUF721 domain-containing protein [Victivallales bacterium]MBR6325090.1 DUF721 domain-containing protein [Victivallales bacterium]